MNFLIKGFIIGLSIAAPVGPIGVLCINRTLALGRLTGFLSGLGAATADAAYGAVAGFGLSFVTTFLLGQQFWLRLVGGLFLVYLGLRTLLSRPAEKEAAVQGRGLAGAYVSTLLLTLTNPITIISFAAVFAGLGIGARSGDYLAASGLVLGVFLGSAAWWLLLSLGVGSLRGGLGPRGRTWINRLAGLVILAFGGLALASLVSLANRAGQA